MQVHHIKKRSVICLRSSGGLQKGWGHVIRSARLAHHLIQSSRKLRIVIVAEGDAAIEGYLKAQGFSEVILLHNPSEVEEREIVRLVSPDVVVIDMLRVPCKLVYLYESMGCRTVLFNDFGLKYTYGDVVICPQVMDVYPTADPKQELLLGSDYFIVPEGLVEMCRMRHDVPVIARNLFVNMGGIVRKAVFEKTICILLHLAERGIQSRFLLGFDSDIDIDVKATSRLDLKGICLVEGTDNLPDLLKDIDFALTASGYMKYEMSAAGIPGVLLAVVDHQIPLGKMFSEKVGSALFLGEIRNADPSHVAAEVYDLAYDQERRREMERAGKKLVDGFALSRIEKVLFSLL